MSIATTLGAARGSSGTKSIDVSAIAPLASPTPADKPPSPGTQPVPPRFADLLRQNRVDAPAPASALPAPSPATCDEDRAAPEPTAPTSSNDAKAPATNAAKARAAATKSASATSTAESTTRTNEGKPDTIDARADSADRDAPAPLASAGIDPGAASALVAGSARAFARKGDVDDVAASTAEDRSTGAEPLRRSLGHARGTAAIDTASDRPASFAEASAEPAAKVGSDAGLQTALVAASDSAEAAHPGRQEHAGDAFAASLAAASTARAADAPMAPTANLAVTVPTPLDSPDFATAFGVQVSVLARDGVQHAELHLNPTEMGPVSIHISLDGSAARVDFGADVAATRQAIERGLPELASALRDAGFTLAGGGVAAHAGSGRSPAGGEGGSPPRSSRLDGRGDPLAPAAIGAAAARVVRRVAAGGVDLYA